MNLTPTVEKQRHPRKPIRYWEAHHLARGHYGDEMIYIDQNNSIAILRAKYGASVIYKAIR